MKAYFSVTVLLLVSAAEVSGQVAVGQVTDGSTGVALSGATVSLLNESREVVARVATDLGGRYSFPAVRAGDYWVVADHLGYGRLESPFATLHADRPTTVDFELLIDPIELDGLRVEAEREDAFRERMTLYGIRLDELGPRFIPRAEIERRQSASDFGVAIRWQGLAGVTVIRTDELGTGRPPEVCVRFRGRGCALTVLNGQIVNQTIAALVPPLALDAVVLLTPIEATLSFGTQGGNGAVMLFTRGSGGGG